MLLVLPFRQASDALSVLATIKNFDDYSAHDFLLVHPDEVNPAPVVEACSALNGKTPYVFACAQAFQKHERVHGANLLMLHISAFIVEKLKWKDSWMFLPSDIQPLIYGWLDRLLEERQLAGKALLYVNSGEVYKEETYPSSLIIYPGTVYNDLPTCRNLMRQEPWRWFARHELTQKAYAHASTQMLDLTTHKEFSARRTEHRYVVSVGSDPISDRVVVVAGGGQPLLDAIGKAYAAFKGDKTKAPSTPAKVKKEPVALKDEEPKQELVTAGGASDDAQQMADFSAFKA